MALNGWLPAECRVPRKVRPIPDRELPLDILIARKDRLRFELANEEDEIPPRPREARVGITLADAMRNAEFRVNPYFDPELEPKHYANAVHRTQSGARRIRAVRPGRYFPHLSEDCPGHCWLPGAEIWVCSQCGITKPI